MDPFTLATPTYRAAVRTCQRSGPALHVYPGRETGFWRHLLAIAALMAVVMMVVGVVAR